MRRPYNGSYSITRPFGVYDAAYSNYPGSRHPGCDYGLPYRTPLIAAISGTAQVIDRGTAKTGRGREVVITNGSTQVKYCHMDSFSISNGQVTEGQVVGYSGFTGYVMDSAGNIGTIGGTHLHFETLINGVYQNPENQYNQGAKDMPIPDQDNYFGRYNKLMMQVRGRPMSRDEFRKNIVGVSDLTAVERISDNAESDRATDAQQWALANRTAVEKQIADLKVALANEKAKPPVEVIKEVEKIVEKEVIKEVVVGEDEAVKSFFSRLIDKLMFFNKKG